MKLYNSQKKKLKIGLSIVFGIILIGIILWKYPFGDVISTFTNFTPKLVFFYLFISFLIMYLLTLRWKIVLKGLGYNVPLHKLFAYRLVGYGVSYITPTAKVGGEPVRAALMKREGFTFREALSSVTIDKTLELSLSLLFFIIGVFFVVLDYALPTGFLIFLVSLAIIIAFFVWKFYSRILRGKPVFTQAFRFLRLDRIKFFSRYQRKLRKFEKPIIDFYDFKKKEFVIASIIGVISLLLSILEYKILLTMLGLETSLGVTFLVLSIVGIAFLIPLPMALGSLEALQASLFSVLGLPIASGIGVAVITRSRDLIWVLISAGISLYMGTFGKVIKKAYSDQPVVKVGISGEGRNKRVDIQIHHPSERNNKSLKIKKKVKQKLIRQKKKIDKPINTLKRKRRNKYYIKQSKKIGRKKIIKNKIKKIKIRKK